MKVLQIITSLSTGGAEKLVVDSVPLYQQKGIEMDVLTLKNEETPFKKVLQKNSRGTVTGLSRGSVYTPLLILKIIPYLKKYDIIHVHLFPALYWVVLAKWLSFSSVKLMYTEHSTNNKRRTHQLLKYIDRFIYRRLDKIICISEKVEANLRQHLPAVPAERFKLIFNGVDIAAFLSANATDIEDFFSAEDVISIQVSSFRSQKDQATVIRALGILDEKYKLLLVGDGPLQKECEELAKDLGVAHRVQFLGIRTDIPALLKMADIVILSSIYEGLSLSSIEGMSVKPFIASDVEGLREIVGGYGVLFEQGNAAELADKIKTLMTDTVLYDKVRQRCAARAAEFDIHKMVQQYLLLYHSTGS